MNRIIFIFIVFINGNFIFSQSVSAENLEKKLILDFENYNKSEYNIRYDSLRDKLKLNVERILSNPKTFKYSFKKLSNYVKIIESKDKKVRIFSWDELTGGSWHDMAVIIQYKNNKNQIKTKWIDSDINEQDNGITSDIIYEINEIKSNAKKIYLCFGKGTFGSGNYHNSMFTFSIENNGLFFNSDMIDKKYSIIQAPRNEKIELEYNKEKKIICFNEYLFNDEIGFFKPTGKKIELKWKKGKFIKNDG